MMPEIFDTAPYFNGTVEVKPLNRKRYGENKKVMDRGLLIFGVKNLARIWNTDYETAHQMIRSKTKNSMEVVHGSGERQVQSRAYG